MRQCWPWAHHWIEKGGRRVCLRCLRTQESSYATDGWRDVPTEAQAARDKADADQREALMLGVLPDQEREFLIGKPSYYAGFTGLAYKSVFDDWATDELERFRGRRGRRP